MTDDIQITATYLSRKPRPFSIHTGISLTLSLLIVSQLYWQGFPLAADRDSVFVHHQYWKLWTAMMAHADLKHLLSNAPAFAFFTGLVYGYFGPVALTVLLLVAGPLINAFTVWTYPPDVSLTGASGIVYLLAGFWVTLFVCIERRFTVTNRLMRSIGFSLVLLFPTAFAPEVSYRAHAIGFGLGILFAIPYFLRHRGRFRSFEVVEEIP